MTMSLEQAVAQLKENDEGEVFKALSAIVNEFGWELTKRDPGPACIFCEDTGWLDNDGRKPCTYHAGDLPVGEQREGVLEFDIVSGPWGPKEPWTDGKIIDSWEPERREAWVRATTDTTFIPFTADLLPRLPQGLEGWAKLAGIMDQDARFGERS